MSGSGRGGSGRGGNSRGGSGRGGSSQEMPYRGGRPGGDDGSRGGRGGYQDGRPPKEPLVDSSVVWKNPVKVPNETTKFEDKWISENKGKRAEKGQLALRPAYGTKGKSIVVRANYFEMELKPSAEFHSYIARIDPEPKAKRHLREIWKKVLSYQTIVEVGGACDNATELITLGSLGDIPIIKVKVPEKDDSHKEYSVKLKLSSIIDHHDVLNALANPRKVSPSDNEAVVVRALNILMAAYPGTQSDVITLGKDNNNKFFWVSDDRKQWARLDETLQCLRGYYASVRPGASSLFLNLSVNHSAFYKPGELEGLWNTVPPNYRTDRQLFSRYVRTLRVQCSHLKDPGENGAVPRVKTIWSLADPDDGKKEPKPPIFKEIKQNGDTPENRRRAFGADAYSVKFYYQEINDYISVADYFQRQYKMKVKPGLPVLNVGNNARPVYLPMDVLTIPPGSVFRGELNLTQRQNIIGFSCRQPSQNYLSIKEHGLDITGVKNNATKRLGMKVHNEMVAVPARILSEPVVVYRGGKKPRSYPGSWNLAQVQFTKSPYQAKKWAGVLIKTSRSRDPGAKSVSALKAFETEMAKLGMSVKGLVGGIKTVNLPDNPKGQLDQLDALISSIKEQQFDFVVIIVPVGADRVFDHLKWRADTVDGVVIHCCSVDKITPQGDPAKPQYFANNAMKINLRLGGVNQSLDPSSNSALIAAGNTMVVGLDVTHPSPTDPDQFPSIASIVASTDKSMGQWPGQVKIQTRRKENVEHLVEMMKARLQRWKKDNGKFPENIVIFRDGVSEGQYDMVLSDELPQIKKACELCRCSPNITVLVGGKRHNTRFFPTSKNDCDRTNNCINGTVVDRVITRPFYWEFFLQAQAPIQGSARSAHYVVIHDEIFTNSKVNRENPADAIQQLTYNICYMMGRCTRSISYSTPAFLADRFADRARKYVRAYYYDQQIRHRDYNPPAPADRVTVLAERLRETMVYI